MDEESKNRETHFTEMISVTFNGKKTPVNNKANEGVSASEHDQLKNWREESEKTVQLEETEPPTPPLKIVPIVLEDVGNGASKPIEDPLDWRAFQPEQVAASLSSSVKNKKRKKRKRINKASSGSFMILVKKFWIPLLSAIIVGLGLGFTVLLLFTPHNSISQSRHITAPPSKVKQTSSTEVTPSTKGSITESGQAFGLNLQVVQVGYYDVQQKAEIDQKKFEGKGVHSVLTTDGAHYALFAGVALTSQHLKDLDSSIASKVPIYDKPWVLSPKKVKGSKKDLQDLKTANTIINKLIPLSLSSILGETIDQSLMTQVQKGLTQMEDPSSSQTPKELGILKGCLLSAYSSINQTTPDGVAAQHALLDAIGHYQHVLNGMTVN